VTDSERDRQGAHTRTLGYAFGFGIDSLCGRALYFLSGLPLTPFGDRLKIIVTWRRSEYDVCVLRLNWLFSVSSV
jgi:hypothetical protein